MRPVLRFALPAVLAALVLASCSGDDKKGLYETCGDASECDPELPGNGVLCAAGPAGGQTFCTVSCGKAIEEAKGASPVATGDCIIGVHDGSSFMCESGCCYIQSSTQENADDQTYAVSGICLPAAP